MSARGASGGRAHVRAHPQKIARGASVVNRTATPARVSLSNGAPSEAYIASTRALFPNEWGDSTSISSPTDSLLRISTSASRADARRTTPTNTQSCSYALSSGRCSLISSK